MQGKIQKKRRFARFLFLLSISLSLIIVFTAFGTYLYFSRDLPNFITIQEYVPNTITKVYSVDGNLIDEFYIERRILIPLSHIPSHLIKAFLAAEDARFFEHQGVDVKSIIRALVSDIKARKIVQGGSTITQQVIKSLFLTPERSLTRKIKEALLAYRIEKNLSKEDILYLYFNQIYLGRGAYGVQAASEVYFGKDVSELTLAEAALLAGLPKAPSRYSPHNHPEAALSRRNYVINRMLDEGFISYREAQNALNEPLRLRPKKVKTLGIAPYFTEYIRKYIEEKYGYDSLYRGGLRIYTTLDINLQRYARDALIYGLKRYDKRHGYRGPLGRLKSKEEIERFIQGEGERLPKSGLEPDMTYQGVVVSNNSREGYFEVRVGPYKGGLMYKDLSWARFNDDGEERDTSHLLMEGDVIEVRVKGNPKEDMHTFYLEQEPEAQAALIALDPYSGEVRAMVGGYDFKKSQFNRAIQARRQPGSAFKPIIYSAALDKGFTPASIIIDSPIIYEETSKGKEEEVFLWKPRNFDEKFHGPITLREALAKSRNVVTIKLLRKLGLSYVRGYAKRLGLTSPLNADLSLALGSSGLSLLELTNAYAVFASKGMRKEPIFIKKIVDRYGKVLEESKPAPEQVISQETAYMMTNLLQGVIQNGTGWRARALGRPAAGKTGTTNGYIDAWFIGYTPEIVAGVWVGFDDQHSLGDLETGSRAALPIWLRFMKEAHRDRPIENFSVPEGVVFVKIDPKTGQPPLSRDEKTIFEVFKKGTQPQVNERKRVSSPSGRFFDLDIGNEEDFIFNNLNPDIRTN